MTNDNANHFFKIKPRVLIVDNNERVGNMYRDLIAYWGFIPIVAQGVGNALIEDAKAKARESRCQFALVDMHLVDDLDAEDRSGMKLVPDLLPTVSIIISADGDPTKVREGGEIGAASYVIKGEGPAVLRQKLERETDKLCASRRGINIEPLSILEEVSKRLGEKIPFDFHDQITDILARLFPLAKELRVEQLEKDNSQPSYSSVPRPKSVILKVYEDKKQPVIVKLARAEKTKIEKANYDKFIEGQLQAYFHPILSRSEILWDVGGAVYTLLGRTEINTFSRYYTTASPNDIEHTLTNFFHTTWEPLYRKLKPVKNISIFEEYCRVWGPEWFDRVCRFNSPDPGEAMGKEIANKIQPTDPIQWLQNNTGRNGSEDKTIVSETAMAVTHGDLHGDNILVDEHKEAWVIDFERSGEGHILQDFIELEADIINRLISSTEKLPSFHQLCIEVARNSDLKELEYPGCIPNPETGKTVSTISLLRSLARGCTGIMDARQYLLGLLFNTLFRATITGETAQKKSQQRSIMLASILCHRIDHWGESWPPQEWQTSFSDKEEDHA